MTNMTKAVETVIKTDSMGRMKTPAERRERLLDEFEFERLKKAHGVAVEIAASLRWSLVEQNESRQYICYI